MAIWKINAADKGRITFNNEGFAAGRRLPREAFTITASNIPAIGTDCCSNKYSTRHCQ